MNDGQAYGQLLENATDLWENRGDWFPGKLVTARVLRRAAADPEYQAAVVEQVAPRFGGADGGSGPTLRDLVALAFEVVLLVYGPSLPLGGMGVRLARDFVLEHLDKMSLPVGLNFQPD
jgi:hypothetical protein